MTKGLNGRAARALAVLGVTALAGCGAPGEGGFGVGDMLLTAGTTQPPAQSAAIGDVYCPTVDVTDGGAALQVRGGGEAGSVRSQITLGEVARECIGQPDGSTVFANRSRRVAAAIPAGQTQTTVSIIEDGIVVPAAYANSFEIEVGLGGRAPAGRRG